MAAKYKQLAKAADVALAPIVPLLPAVYGAEHMHAKPTSQQLLYLAAF